MNNFIPPLRLVLTNKCNGKCVFCHHEGYNGKLDMSIDLAIRSATVAQKMNIPYISLTGGEPTLHSQLSEIISVIQQTSTAKISLTTNGYNLLELCDKIEKQIQKLNISITSFVPEINRKYQNVDIDVVKASLLKFPAIQKNFNVVVNQDNIKHLDEIVSFCNSNLIDLDLMFDMSDYTKTGSSMVKSTVEKIKSQGEPVIIPGCTSCLNFTMINGATIRLKHPQISALIKRNICKNCNEYVKCLEKVCSVRVYPDGTVSPCLSGHHYFNHADVEKNIVEAYKLFDQDGNLLYTLLEQ